jgi:hypothetical protein
VSLAVVLAPRGPFDDADHLESCEVAELVDAARSYQNLGNAASEVLGDRPRIAAGRPDRLWSWFGS